MCVPVFDVPWTFSEMENRNTGGLHCRWRINTRAANGSGSTQDPPGKVMGEIQI